MTPGGPQGPRYPGRDRFDRSYDDALGVISARRRKRRAAMRRRHNRGLAAAALIVLVFVFLTAIAGGTAGAGIAAYSVVENLHLKDLPKRPLGVNSNIYYANGQHAYTIPSPVNRKPVTWRHVSPWMAKATVDIEDHRFYDHGGVDYQAVFRALLDDFEAGHVVQGASTIEQQIVKNAYLDGNLSLTRKLKEAWLATQMAQQWSKHKILTEYLNIAPYGGVTYGCEAAAETYFSVHCHDLGITQAALLAGLPQAPTTYNPNLNAKAALDRRNDVLASMWAYGDLTQAQYERAVKTGLKLHPRAQNAGHTSYAVKYVIQMAQQEYGKKMLHQGGLVIHTTFVPKLQAAAHRAMEDYLHTPGQPAAAIVSIDPRTGAILAMDSTVDPNTSSFNIPADAKRQAGSSFKPFGLMAGMVYDHIDPETQRYNSASPFRYTLCTGGYASCTWTVNNAEPGGGGNLNLHVAMDGSVNAVFAQLAIDISPEQVAKMAHRLGIPGHVELPGTSPSIILGTGSVSALNMAGAYTTFAANGIRHNPLAITSVTSYNKKIHDATPPGKNPGHRVVPAWAASEMNKILYDNVYTCPSGECTGAAARLSDGRPVAGKTGTVEDHQDAWFCGYSPNLTTCVWMGFPSGETSMINSTGFSETFGGGIPTEIWNDYMSKAFALYPKRFPATAFKDVPPPADAFEPPFVSQFHLALPPVKHHKPGKKDDGDGAKDNGKKSDSGGNATT